MRTVVHTLGPLGLGLPTLQSRNRTVCLFTALLPSRPAG